MTFILNNAEKIVCAVLLLAMTALGFANVVVRYATSYSLAASEELLTNGFLLLTVFGAAVAARRGEHLAVTLFYDILPRPLRGLVLILAGTLSTLLLVLSAWYSFELLSNQMASGIRSYALQVPAWYYGAAVPFGFALVAIRHVQHILEAWSERAGKETGDA